MSSVIPRPFYIIGHNTNSIAEVRDVLERGANAIECDINCSPAGHLCVNHDAPWTEGHANPLVPYLIALRGIVDEFPRLAMVMFDSKIDGPGQGKELLDLIRTHLTADVGLTIIISVADRSMKGFFDQIHAQLLPHEGLMIDQEDDPAIIEDLFEGMGVVNHCYGNGLFVAGVAPNVRTAMEHAAAMKAMTGKTKWVYSWTLGKMTSMREHILVGVDGIIVNDIQALVQVVNEPAIAAQVRMAQRSDDPFVLTLPAYGLTITTDAREHAGTDANVTFRLTGSKATVQKTIDSAEIKRYESGDTNFLALLGVDVGLPLSITVSRDDAGNAPDWFLDTISVASRNEPGVTRVATFQQWIPANRPVVRTFGSEVYRLTVKTSDTGGAGTDANVTFTLKGDLGTVEQGVDAGPVGLFESGDTNLVEISGMDIGPMRSLSVVIDDTGNGPGWFLGSVIATHVGSGMSRTFLFNQWVYPGTPVSRSPFEATYNLTVKTGTLGGAGTDANITFTLKGDKGSVSRSVDAQPVGLFESGNTNSVKLQGMDVGAFQSLTVAHDNQGNAPGWFLDSITAAKAGGPGTSFSFGQWIETGTPVTRTPDVAAYTLTVKTGSIGSAGTDANITFTLKGALGSVTQTVDAQPVGWFETGDTDSVSIKGMDIGAITALTVAHDTQGNGPDWYLDSVTAGKTGGAAKSFAFDQWIYAGTPVTRAPAEASYTLVVKTDPRGGAGTDANIAFVLKGAKGQVSRTIDATPPGLFEAGNSNPLVLQGMDIGAITALTVSHDNQGNGPDWYLATITATKGGGGAAKTFTFDQWVVAGQSVTRQPDDASYTLVVKTDPRGGAGTDTNVSFRLKGDKGTIVHVVDTQPAGLFEAGQTNMLSFKGADVGNIQSLTISHDNQGNGPDWYVGTVTATKAGAAAKTFIFDQWIFAPTPVTRTPADATYTLVVKTGDKSGAGTDANITFVLEGTQGTLSKVVDADPAGLFESGYSNNVNLQGADIGTVSSVSVTHDDAGNGPGWFVDSVAVKKGTKVLKNFSFNQWVYSGTTVTRS